MGVSQSDTRAAAELSGLAAEASVTSVTEANAPEGVTPAEYNSGVVADRNLQFQEVYYKRLLQQYFSTYDLSPGAVSVQAQMSGRGGKVRALPPRRKKKKVSQNVESKRMNITPAEPRRNVGDINLRWMPVFPAKTVRKLRYADYFNLAGTSGAVATHVFAANGLFDTDITGTGHQPMGFDQMMLSYEHYTVIKARCLCTFFNLANTQTKVALKVDGAATPITVADQLLEWGLINTGTLNVVGVDGCNVTLQQDVDIGKFEGVGRVLDEFDLRGTVAANPVEITYFHVQSWGPNAVTTSVLCEIVFEYLVAFTEPRVLTESLSSEMKRLLVDEQSKNS